MGREIVSIATALVPYPPERVWAVVTDLDCWQWRSDLSRLDHVGEDAFTEYDRSGFPTRFTVTERRPLSRWAFDLDNANLAEADAAGYQTVQTDVTIFPAFYEPAILTMNSDLYDSLSPDLREAVDRCGREAMADQRLRNREQEAEILERWQEEDGIAVHVLTEEQWGAFQALTERLYDPEDPDHQDWFADCTPEWVEQFRPS